MPPRKPSAPTLLLSLDLLERGDAAPAQVVRALEKLSAGTGDGPEELQNKLSGEKDTSALAPRPGVEHVHIHCPDCRSLFRVRPRDLDDRPVCPLCSTPVAPPLFRPGRRETRSPRRAAEAENTYRAGENGQRCAHFELLSSIGSGGTGRVYRARNRRTGQEVAVKICRFSPVEAQADSWERALREAKAATLDHPHVVTVYDVGLAEGSPFLEMEYLPGGSVHERGVFSIERARSVGHQVLSALSQAHQAGIVHRDLKPSNILLDADDRAKLSDFGLCKLLDEASSTTTGKILGSPHFMAPEQWTGGEVGPYTDVYSFGLVFYFLLTGSLPFDADDALSIMYKHLHYQLPDPGEQKPGTHDGVCRFLRRAAAKKPGDRYADAEECRTALADML